MFTALALVLLQAAPGPIKLAAPPLSAVDIKPELQAFASDHLNQQLTIAGIRVLGASEISAVLGLERQKVLLGCSDKSANCVAEIANALGVDGLLLGTVAQLGTALQLDTRVVAASDAHVLAVFSARVTDSAQLPDALAAAALALSQQLAQQFHRRLEPLSLPSVVVPGSPTDVRMETRSTNTRIAGGIVFLGCSAAVIGGIVAAGLSGASQPGGGDQTAATAGGALILGGAVGMVIGGLMYGLGGTEQVPVVAAPKG